MMISFLDVRLVNEFCWFTSRVWSNKLRNWKCALKTFFLLLNLKLFYNLFFISTISWKYFKDYHGHVQMNIEQNSILSFHYNPIVIKRFLMWRGSLSSYEVRIRKENIKMNFIERLKWIEHFEHCEKNIMNESFVKLASPTSITDALSHWGWFIWFNSNLWFMYYKSD